jgi:L-arabinose isomerase
VNKIKPRIGVLAFQSQWFKDAGLTGGNEAGAARSLGETILADSRFIAETLEKHAAVVMPEPVTTAVQASEAAQEFIREQVDLVVICPIVWSEDTPLFKVFPLLQRFPLVLWCYSPHLRPPAPETLMGYLRNSGLVGAMQFSGALKKCGLEFEFVVGSVREEATINRLMTIADAAAVRARLRETKLGVVACPCDQMRALYSDEVTLVQKLGVTLKYGSVAQLAEQSRRVREAEVNEFVHKLRSRFHTAGAEDEAIVESVRASLGVGRLLEAMGVDAIVLNDVDEEMHQTFGLRPGFYPWMFSEDKRVIGLEGDYGTTTMLLILAMLTGKPVAFEETLSFDLPDNVLVFNHGGPQDPDLAANPSDPTITVDVEWSMSSDRYKGAVLEFAARPGCVTMLNHLYTPQGMQMTVAGGESLGGPPRIPGAPQFIVRPYVPVERFLSTAGQWGATHHWAMVHGNVVPPIEVFCRLAGIPLLTIK